MTALAYLALVLVALAVLWAAKRFGHPIDSDVGPSHGHQYPLWDSWSKYHLIGSAILGFASCALGVDPLWAFAITVLGGVGWELVHGHVDRGDLLWDSVGAVAGAMLGLFV